ncbi:hypothetical protein PHMEG_0009754 [Phytophthora megakarya]|uniref:HAT C-terminal dimerisation domain-containing protein n=1 Tax=Phytophthora megakarya TaxID=4795 RepID=A0A225WFE8_9STRA|nr:hypothetical protein PHMEG_0009754 [Phytophthora megakarya]
MCRWFGEYGVSKFSSVGKLARVWLSRGCSTASQESVFSIGSVVMTSFQTHSETIDSPTILINWYIY